MTDDEISLYMFKVNWKFILGAPEMRFLPEQSVPEIAFAGRSNVGKSSILNALTNTKIARISNTPGRTQELNFFMPETKETEPPFQIVDMPGYGYAKVKQQVVKNWTKTIFAYLKGRATLKRVFVLIDARHGIKENDLEVLNLLDKTAVSYQIVLTKIDKIKEHDCKVLKEKLVEKMQKRPAAFAEVIATSSAKNKGLDELKYAICFAAGMLKNGLQ